MVKKKEEEDKTSGGEPPPGGKSKKGSSKVEELANTYIKSPEMAKSSKNSKISRISTVENKIVIKNKSDKKEESRPTPTPTSIKVSKTKGTLEKKKSGKANDRTEGKMSNVKLGKKKETKRTSDKILGTKKKSVAPEEVNSEGQKLRLNSSTDPAEKHRRVITLASEPDLGNPQRTYEKPWLSSGVIQHKTFEKYPEYDVNWKASERNLTGITGAESSPTTAATSAASRTRREKRGDKRESKLEKEPNEEGGDSELEQSSAVASRARREKRREKRGSRLEKEGNEEGAESEVEPEPSRHHLAKIVESNETKEKKDKDTFTQFFNGRKLMTEDPTSDPDQVKEESRAFKMTEVGKDLNSPMQKLFLIFKYTMRLPFGVNFEKDSIQFVIGGFSPSYIFYTLQTILSFLILLWLSVALFFMYFFPADFGAGGGPECVKKSGFLLYLGKNIVSKYFLELTYYWLLLFYGWLSSAFMLYMAQEYAMFGKGWYRLVEATGLRIQLGVSEFIIRQHVLMVARVIFVFLFWLLPFLGVDFVPVAIYGTCNVMGMSMIQLLTFGKSDMVDERGKPNELEKYSFLGLCVYILGVFYCEMSLMLYKVSCVLLKNSIARHEVKIVYCLAHHRRESLDTEADKEELSFRATFSRLYDDHVKIYQQGKRIALVFDSLLIIYYFTLFWKILMNLSVLAFIDYRDPVNAVLTTRVCAWDQFIEDDAALHMILSHLFHLVVVLIDLFWVTMLAIEAGEAAAEVHEVIRRHGLIRCRTNVERSFIRSMYGLGDPRRPMVISPGHLFVINRALITDFVLVVFLYFLLILQMRESFDLRKQRSIRSSYYSRSNCTLLFDLAATASC